MEAEFLHVHLFRIQCKVLHRRNINNAMKGAREEREKKKTKIWTLPDSASRSLQEESRDID